MFKKSFAVKKTLSLKNSERRKFFARLPERISSTLDSKSSITYVKIVTTTDSVLYIYSFDRLPKFFHLEGDVVLFPTLHYVWDNPRAYANILIYAQTLYHLDNGADLMAPGVLTTIGPLATFNKGDPVAISVFEDGNVKGPLYVGLAILSSDEIYGGMNGKAIRPLHCFQDHLWEHGGVVKQPPIVTLADFTKLAEETPDVEVSVEGLSLEEDKPVDISELREEMETTLLRCFLAGIKHRLKKDKLPIDVGQFYAECVLSCLPEDKNIDIKKTKYKKFGTFIEEINKDENGILVKVEKKNKGEGSISEINWAHPLIKKFEAVDEIIEDEKDGSATGPPAICDYYAVTAPVLPLLKEVCKVTKGQLLDATTVRSLVTAYVKKEELNLEKTVKLDPLLADITGKNSNEIEWNALFQIVVSKMTKTFVIRYPSGKEVVRKTGQPHIDFKVETRAGNRKVTIINNIAVFGIDPKTFCHEIQIGIASRATITNTAVLCEGPQVSVQGNQVAFVGNLLQTKYGIDKKFIKGLELAPKNKK
ncbi:unnamed protein product [Auanema sp. JU1783]|nr:unnamed protein product [Auanema sp. JU1783]